MLQQLRINLKRRTVQTLNNREMYEISGGDDSSSTTPPDNGDSNPWLDGTDSNPWLDGSGE
ncbi:hypothetical protein [Leptobacterium sp. I13]|uniref:hypothetical protein n=1 Tax=Leptobacterium meishanense TaxID=3128904 RepID=UPI0030EEE13F